MNNEADFTVPEVFEIVGYLWAEYDEFGGAHPGDVSMKISEAMDAVRADRNNVIMEEPIELTQN